MHAVSLVPHSLKLKRLKTLTDFMDQYQATYILTLEILRTQGMAGSLTMKIEQN